MAKGVLEELVTFLGFEVDDADLKRYEATLDDVHKGLQKIATVGGVAAAGLSLFINKTAEGIDNQFKFAKTVGASFEEVQKLTHATRIWGGDIGDVTSTLTNLSRIISTAARGTGGGEIFGILDLDPRDAEGRLKTSISLLSEVADRISRIDNAAEQAEFAQKLGISQNMILLLREGSAGISELGAELEQFGFVLTKEQAETAEAYVDSIVRGQAAVKGLAQQIGIRLAPQVAETVDAWTKWVTLNQELIASRLDVWVGRLNRVMEPLAIFSAVIGLSLGVWFFFANKTLGKVILIAGAVSLIIEDVKRFMSGEGGSFLERIEKGTGIADLLEAGGLGEKLAGAREFFAGLLKGPQFTFGAQQPGAIAGGSQTTNRNTLGPVTVNIRANDTAGVSREVQAIFRGDALSLFEGFRTATTN